MDFASASKIQILHIINAVQLCSGIIHMVERSTRRFCTQTSIVNITSVFAELFRKDLSSIVRIKIVITSSNEHSYCL